MSTMDHPEPLVEEVYNPPWMAMYVSFIVCVSAWEQYLNYRQYRRLAHSGVPEALAGLVDEEEHRKANKYSISKLIFSSVNSVIETGITVVTTVLYFGPYLWSLSGDLVGTDGEMQRSLVFVGLAKAVSDVVSLPFELFYDFVLEASYGFNKKTLKLFFKDKLIGLLLSAVFGIPIIMGLIWVVKMGGPYFYLYASAFCIAIMFLGILIYPNLIAPLFNKFEPLGDVELRGKIQDLAQSIDFPLTELYQIDGSTRSSHSNAYFFGLFKWKRIVLYDTLLHLPHLQVQAILAHELGHWSLNHMTKMLLVQMAIVFNSFYIYSRVMHNDTLFKAFGYPADGDVIIGLTLAGFILAPINAVVTVLATILSRVHEFQADGFAAKLGYSQSLQEGLLNIHKENMAALSPDYLYSWYHHSHPSLVERLNALKNSPQSKRD